MLIKTKINFKKYFGLTALTTLFCFLFLNNIEEVYGVLSVYLATIINHFMLAEAVFNLTEPNKVFTKKEKFVLFTMLLGKIVILFLGLSLGVHFMGNRVIIPLLNYVVQIFLLGVSFEATHLWKGNNEKVYSSFATPFLF